MTGFIWGDGPSGSRDRDAPSPVSWRKRLESILRTGTAGRWEVNPLDIIDTLHGYQGDQTEFIQYLADVIVSLKEYQKIPQQIDIPQMEDCTSLFESIFSDDSIAIIYLTIAQNYVRTYAYQPNP